MKLIFILNDCLSDFLCRFLLIFIYLIPLTEVCHSQSPTIKFRKINREQGLSNSTVQCIYQDCAGFMWFGTADGLNRYDGYKTIVYQNNPTDNNSIKDNFVTCILEDKKQNLWVSTGTGLNRFNRDFNNFSRFNNQPENPASISSNVVHYLYQDRSDNLWIATMNGLNLLNKEGNGFNLYSNLKYGLHADDITCLYEDRKGIFWVGTNSGGLFQFNRETKQFKSIPFQKPTDVDNSNFITAITEDVAGNLLVGTNGGGIVVVNLQQNSFKNYRHYESKPGSLSNDVVKCLLTSRKNVIWVGTENGGLNRLDSANGSFKHYENDPDNPTSLSQKTTSAIFEDNLGNLWVGTHRGGINLYCPAANKFENYTQGKGSLSFKDVKTFFEDSKGLIWIGTDGGGVNIWNRKTGVFEQYRHQKENPSSIGSDAILHIMQNRAGNVWVGTWGGGLNLYLGNGKFKKFLHEPNNAASISSNNVWHLFEDSRDNLWVCTSYGGLNLFNRKTQSFTRITADSNKTNPFLGHNVVTANEDKNKNLWFITSDGGLNFLDVQMGRLEHYFYQGRDLLDGGTGNLKVIFIDSRQKLWIGKKGLYQFDFNQKTFSRYTGSPELANEYIQGITEDNRGILWISTSNGLFSHDPVTKTTRQYSTTEGLQGLEYNQNACLRLASGEMLFGGFNGFNVFNPINILADSIAPSVYITDLQIFNKSMEYGQPGSPLKSPVGQTREIKLNYGQSAFSLEYAALEYASPGETKYAYKLDGFDKNWNYVGTQRKAIFTNLDPGVYTFHVKAATHAGLWNDQDTMIKIIILPPYWMTWWFRMLVAILLSGIAYSLFFYHRKYESKRLDEQKTKELQKMQLQFFTNISHEFRTPLSLISGPLELIQKESGVLPKHQHYYQMMQRNVNRLMGLVSELMDFRKVEEGVLKLQVMQSNLGLFVAEIAEDFAELAIQHNIRFNVNLPEPLAEVWFDHQVMEKVIINLIHNAFKYTADGGIITIEVLGSLKNFVLHYENELVVKSDFQASKEVYIRIIDTGRGISKESIRYLFERYYRITQEHLGSGVGLAFVKSLTKLHKGAIHVYSQLHRGTEIIIALPCTRKDYTDEERWIGPKEVGEVQLETVRYKTDILQPIPLPITAQPKATLILKTILIVDDNEELRSFLRECLSGTYSISEAENGSEGLKKAREETPNLVISDVMMPVMDGIEFCRQLKEDIQISHIPFIMLTAKNALQAKMDGIGGGADYYFSKPVNVELLQLTIRNLFEQRLKMKERFSNDHNVEVRELVHSAKDREFITDLIELMELQLENTELNVDYICQQIGMSRTKLYKKIKDLTGQTINDFIRVFRLKKAVEIMTNEDMPVMEVMYRIGIQSHSHFTTSFKKEFGKTPSQFMQEMEGKRKAKEYKNRQGKK